MCTPFRLRRLAAALFWGALPAVAQREQGHSVLGERLFWSAVACHFGVRELAPALHWGQQAAPSAPTAASRLTEQRRRADALRSTQCPHSKLLMIISPAARIDAGRLRSHTGGFVRLLVDKACFVETL